MKVLDILNLLFIVVSIIFFTIFRNLQLILKNRYRILEASEDDYSILV